MNLTSLTLVLPLHPFCKPHPSWTNSASCFLSTYGWASASRKREPSIPVDSHLCIPGCCRQSFHVCLDTLSHSSEQLLQAAPTFPGPIPSALDGTATPEGSSPSCQSACPGLALLPHLNPCPNDFLSFFSFFKIEVKFS